jgi:hypothetical protein
MRKDTHRISERATSWDTHNRLDRANDQDTHTQKERAKRVDTHNRLERANNQQPTTNKKTNNQQPTKKHRMKTKIKDIKLDPVILELRPVNQFVVCRYRQAMRNGDRFPDLVIDQDMSLVCGYHRQEAYLQEYGEEHTVDAVKRAYKSEADRIEDAVKDNARHGMPLDGITRKRVICKLAELGRNEEHIAKLLGVSVKRVEELAGFTVIVRGVGKAVSRRPVKAGAESIVGTKVRADEYEEHIEKDLGIDPGRCANQLIRWLKNDWIDQNDEKLVESLRVLRGLLERI